jgi:hypothetical protein
MYTQENPPNFALASEFWQYTVTFHNAVNKRTGKLEFSMDEAEESHRQFLVDIRGNLFLDAFWHVLLYTTHVYAKNPDEATGAEAELLQSFLEASCFTLPFWTQATGNTYANGQPELVRDVLLKIVQDTKADMYQSKEASIQQVTVMYNAVCQYFETLPKTAKELTDGFLQYFTTDDYTKLVRAHQIREEDHKKMLALQKEMHNLRNIHGRETEHNPSTPWRISTLVLSVVLSILVLVVVVRFIGWRRGSKNPAPGSSAPVAGSSIQKKEG